MARENAQRQGATCRFIVADLLGDMHEVRDTFDVAYDLEVLHHIFPEDRKTYLKNVRNLLNPKATYLSVSFSDNDSQFGGKGKFRKTPIGTTLYFSSEHKILDLFLWYFKILELKQLKSAENMIRIARFMHWWNVPEFPFYLFCTGLWDRMIHIDGSRIR